MALTDSLLAYYKMEGNSNDSLGSYNGTDTNITYGTDYGKIGQGADFNGSSSKITNSSWNNPTTNFSISCWINADALPGTDTLMTFMSKYSTAATTGGVSLQLYNQSGTQKVAFICYNSSTGLDCQINYAYTLSTGVWYHLVGIYDTTVGAKLYINGEYKAKVDDTGNLLNPASRILTIGCANYDGTNYVRFFDGSIDELGMWSKTLSAAEITALYNGGSGFQYPFSTTAISSINGLAKSSVGSFNGLAIASVKSINGLE